MTRDEFAQSTKEALAKRVGYVCSNPACRQPTSGPSEETDKAICVGQAAHITAASERGPRYDHSLTPDERRSLSNGIWLCYTCAKLIDSDKSAYTTEKLHEWRQDAETAAKLALEQRRSTYTGDLGVFVEAQRLMPELIAEMIMDTKEDDTSLIREFVVRISKKVTYCAGGKPRLYYYEDEHYNLLNMLDWMEEGSLITCISRRFENSPPVYHFNQEFYNWLRNDERPIDSSDSAPL